MIRFLHDCEETSIIQFSLQYSTYTIIRYVRVRCSYRRVNTEQIEKIGLATFSRQKLHFRLWFYTTAVYSIGGVWKLFVAYGIWNDNHWAVKAAENGGGGAGACLTFCTALRPTPQCMKKFFARLSSCCLSWRLFKTLLLLQFFPSFTNENSEPIQTEGFCQNWRHIF